MLEKGAEPDGKVTLGMAEAGMCSNPPPEGPETNTCEIVTHNPFLDCDLDGIGQNMADVTPLDLAASEGRLDVVKLLVEAGADVNARSESWLRPLQFAIMNYRDNRLEIVRYLLERGASPNGRSKFGNYALHQAAKTGDLAVARLLIEHGALINAPNRYGITPLHVAAKEDHANIIALLLAHGADPSPRDDCGATPLAWARHDKMPCAEMVLLKHHAEN